MAEKTHKRNRETLVFWNLYEHEIYFMETEEELLAIIIFRTTDLIAKPREMHNEQRKWYLTSKRIFLNNLCHYIFHYVET